MPIHSALAALLLALAACAPPAGPPDAYALVNVHDGDSVRIIPTSGATADGRGRRMARLAQIDAPELKQPGGRASKAALERLVAEGADIHVVDHDTRYDRPVVHLRDPAGRDLAREMARQGHAWAYRDYLSDPLVLWNEWRARWDGAGLWALPADERTPPWEWRAERRAANKAKREAAG